VHAAQSPARACQYGAAVPRRLGIVVLLALTACTGGSKAPVAAPTSAAPSPTASPPPASAPPAVSAAPSVPPSSVLLVAADPVGNAGLYSLAPRSQRAQLMRTLESRGDWSIGSVSLSAGPTPTICAVWVGQAEPSQGRQLRCYAAGDSRGRIIRSENPVAVAVRADGRAVAWIETEPNANSVVVVAYLAGDAATVRSRFRHADVPPDGGIPEGVTDVSWLGPRTQALTDVGDSDEGKGLCVLDLDQPRERTAVGFGRCLTPGAADAKAGYDRFEDAALLANGTALTVERGHQCCDDALGPSGRAVVVRLSDGAVLDVVATPAVRRAVVDVTGGARAVVYVTAGEEDEARASLVYVRWPGEAHGARVSGLPELTKYVAAQP
jgi:hypothetical protein